MACSEKQKEYARAWYAANRERVSAQAKARLEAMSEEERAEFKETSKKRVAAWVKAHRPRVNEQVRALYTRKRAAGQPRRQSTARELKRAREHVAERRADRTEEQRRLDNDAALVYYRQFKDENPERHRANVHKSSSNRRAREAKAEGSYSAQDVRDCLAQQGGRCFYCLASLLAGYHVDHMMPLSRGGSNNADNIVCACASCNLRKHAKTAEEFILSNL